MKEKLNEVFAEEYGRSRPCQTCEWLARKQNRQGATLLKAVFAEREKGGRMVSFSRLADFLKREYSYPFKAGALRRHWLHR